MYIKRIFRSNETEEKLNRKNEINSQERLKKKNIYIYIQLSVDQNEFEFVFSAKQIPKTITDLCTVSCCLPKSTKKSETYFLTRLPHSYTVRVIYIHIVDWRIRDLENISPSLNTVITTFRVLRILK